jgi:hypothetical protein
MKLNENTRFPHPVLCEYTSDYKSGSFKVDINVTEDMVENSLLLLCETKLNEPYLTQLIGDNLAKVYIVVSCRGTYFYKQLELDNPIKEFKFKPGELTGLVEIRGIIVSDVQIIDFKSNNLNEEYNNDGLVINKAELLAFDVKHKIYVGRKKIPPMESIFEIAFDADLNEGEIDISLEQNKIRILANRSTCRSIHELRSSGKTSTIIFSSVYLPAIMQTLTYLKENGDELAEYLWYESFLAKCDFYNVDIKNDNVLTSAQKLLKYPFKLLMEQDYE